MFLFLKALIFMLPFFNLCSCQSTPRIRDDLIQNLWGQIDEDNVPTMKSEVSTGYSDSNISQQSSCTCVDYYLCSNGTINTNGESIIDIRINTCGSYLEKCCGADKIIIAPSTPPRTKAKGCGYRNPDGVGFKIQNATNNEAEFGEFPWMTAIFYREKSVDGLSELPIYQCGGSLIHPKVVLTAAHCAKDKPHLKIRAGEWDTQTKKEQYPFQERDVADVVIHPKFNPGSLFNDIALLILKSEVEIAPHINVVCLPAQDAIIDKKRCFSSGWGKNNFGREDKYQVILKKIDLPIVLKEECQENLRKTRLGKHFRLDESFICAGGEEGKDTCTGDGGSPLICPIERYKEKYWQTGIVAWGIGCGNRMVPGVYVNVALFRNWIDEELRNRGININDYQSTDDSKDA